MTAQLVPVGGSSVNVADGVVHIRDLSTSDPDLVTLLVEGSDPTEVVLRVLAIGARVLAVSRTSMDTAVIEKSFGVLVDQLGGLLNDATAQVAGTTSSLLTDPESGVHASLTNWKRDVAETLNAIFDPDRSTSAIGKLDAVMQSASEKQLIATRRLLNAEDQDSPLFGLFAGVQTQIGLVLDSVARVAEQVATDKATVNATALALEHSAVKGMAFEDQVVQAVTGLAAAWGDVTEAVGRASGVSGGLVGDVVVELDRTDSCDRSARYVIECKDRRLTLNATLSELRRASINREAGAAIAVFAHDEQCPVPGPFATFDDLAIVVYDKNDPDPAALRLACAWARWSARRQPITDGGAPDADLILSLLSDARKALDRTANIRRAHTAASKKIQEAAGQVSDLSAEVTEALNKVEQALNG